jgi:hypothetical protein
VPHGKGNEHMGMSISMLYPAGLESGSSNVLARGDEGDDCGS